jgi:hypothetical protein
LIGGSGTEAVHHMKPMPRQDELDRIICRLWDSYKTTGVELAIEFDIGDFRCLLAAVRLSPLARTALVQNIFDRQKISGIILESLRDEYRRSS